MQIWLALYLIALVNQYLICKNVMDWIWFQLYETDKINLQTLVETSLKQQDIAQQRYNDYGYNKFILLTSKILFKIWFQMSRYYEYVHGYNKNFKVVSESSIKWGSTVFNSFFPNPMTSQ